MKLIKELYAYRELLKNNIKKDIRGKYKGSFLGVLWTFMNPLLMTLVYAIVFPYLMRGAQYEHYTTFLVIGILAWNWFGTCISQGTYTILGNGGIIKKVYFPREILPISVVTSGLINYLITLIIIAFFLIFSGIGFNIYMLWLPLIIITQYILTLGIIFITGAINVYARDLEYLIGFLIQMLFYATPIIYTIDIFGNSFVAKIIKLNPMTSIINSYRNVLYWGEAPEIKSLIIVLMVSIIGCLIGLKIFQKLSKGFAEEV